MSESKHTPGPWTIGVATCAYSDASCQQVYYGRDGECVAEVVGTEPDARLISAAPDLLEACQATIEHGHLFPISVSEIMKAAIAKATGEVAK